MSNYLAITTVTASLGHFLQQFVEAAVPNAKVTTERPDGTGNTQAGARLNIYLYQVTPNAAWRNADLPTRDSDGNIIQKPRAALDLHYLLSFYGKEAEFEPQRMLGNVVNALHAKPVLTRKIITDAIKNLTTNNSALAFLNNSNLVEEIELVKFTPTTLTLEELSRLWAVFFQTQYALSATYQASVVLIESEDTPRPTLPVRERNVYAIPLQFPIVEKIRPASETEDAIIAGGDIVISGRNLRGDVTRVSFGGSGEQVAPAEVTNIEIKLTLPPGLRAGAQGLQIVQMLMIGSPPVEHRGVESNIAAFALRPVITVPAPIPAGGQGSKLTKTTENGVDFISGKLDVNFTPKVGKTQRVVLLLNEFNPPGSRPPRAYKFAAPKDNGVTDQNQNDTATIAFDINRVVAGDYLVRAQVDGAENKLEREMNESSPAFNQYTGPRAMIS